MVESQLLITISFIGFFLALTSLLQTISKKLTFPYSILLLIAGFTFKIFSFYSGYHIPFIIGHEFIYYIILPLLLFESAYNVNFYQFKREFKTISFLATFGILVSIAVIGLTLPILISLPIGIALLFGALISATDPIAVLALFKSLGVPRRLRLIADGESMLNDATAVILFNLIAGFVVTQVNVHPVTLFSGVLNFFYVFFGSIIFGGVFGFIISKFIQQIQNDRFVETTLTITLAISAFLIAEHGFHLSGVIATVAAGITLGNLGKTTISGGVIRFMGELWEYVSFLAISIVFFFAAISIDLNLLLQNPVKLMTIIAVVLIARAVSIYLSFYISNRVEFFKTEPNTPKSWQHVLNWGGLRGVIPLVLVYSLPDWFAFKQYLLIATIGTLLFSLFINGLTIKWLMIKLKLHIPDKEDLIRKEQKKLLKIEKERRNLKELSQILPNTTALRQVRTEIQKEQQKHKKQLLKIATVRALRNSLKHQALKIEHQSLDFMFHHGFITESSYYKIDSQLGEIEDAINFPELFERSRLIDIISRKSEATEISNISELSFLKRLTSKSKKDKIRAKARILKVKAITYENVLDYLDNIKRFFKDKPTSLKAIATVRVDYIVLQKNIKKQLQLLEKQYPEVVEEYQKTLIKALILHK